MKYLLIITVLFISFNTVSAKENNKQNKAGAVISETYSPITARTYYLESKTQGSYRAFVKAFNAGQVQNISKGYKLENGQFYKAFARVWKYTEATPRTIKGYKAKTINRF